MDGHLFRFVRRSPFAYATESFWVILKSTIHRVIICHLLSACGSSARRRHDDAICAATAAHSGSASMEWIWYITLFEMTMVVTAWITPPRHRHKVPQRLDCSNLSSDCVWVRREDGEWAATSLHDSNIAAETWRWCADFVVPLDLCPWAAASVNTQGALQIYLAEQNEMEEAVHKAARQLRHDVEEKNADPGVAITFVVCSQREWDFSDFYEWFEDLEESFFEDDFVTLAPFHPEWQFGDGPPELDIEKRSPYPTITVVCTSVIDKAGPAATEQIGEHNEQVLLDLGISKLQQFYQTKVFHKDSPS